ncbi:energy-coupling factor ABC transporter ATP-binding protein [Alkalilimnicola ehrlichii MLHE-1]|uniref:ABC transporter related protein n=1 Tax=Alkalilimnicola ehrlichii (strain ATCC BAA-1101 / DSM 17681 / MLHE-1) TaxID=187272 RepID=Q0A710_ALKEH|nr:ABC transporter ATP-binding protein [Alkalilimnicola ehrlichii]ABI57377.1 ABC transporter related protein [Alkalilimnicola ehrlichii MLHE-1]
MSADHHPGTDPTSQTLYALTGVAVRYPGGRVALREVDLQITAGERIVLLGTNGCGKSTLLKVLNGLIPPCEGRLCFEGKRMGPALRDRDWERAFRRRVALMFQHPEAMLFNPTVAEEIAYGLGHLTRESRRRRCQTWANRLGLAHLLDAPPSQLSGGEKQRLCLACLLAPEPEVLLLDEPTANLDPRTTGWLLEWLATQAMTTVVATHYLPSASDLGERAIVLGEDHRVVFDGPVKAALADRALLLANNLAY